MILLKFFKGTLPIFFSIALLLGFTFGYNHLADRFWTDAYKPFPPGPEKTLPLLKKGNFPRTINFAAERVRKIREVREKYRKDIASINSEPSVALDKIFSPAETEIVNIAATSVLEDPLGKNSFSSANIADGKGNTSWCEGAEGYGIGETIRLTLNKKVSVRSFHIRNGFHDRRTFRERGRIKAFLLNGKYLIRPRDTARYQTVFLPEAVTAKTLLLEIKEVYEGRKRKDTCLTELRLGD